MKKIFSHKFFISLFLASIVVLGFLFLNKQSIQAAPTVNIFWVGGNGSNWSEPLNWSYSSGGPTCNCLPGPSDIVGFNSSGNTPVIFNTPRTVGSLVFFDGYTSSFSNPAGNTMTIANDLYVESAANIDFGNAVWNIGDDVILTLDGGFPVVALSGATVNLGGDWNNAGASVSFGTSTVNLNGAGLNQNIFGNNSFYNLIIDPTNTKFIGLQQSSTTTITNNFIATGVDASKKVHIQSVNTSGLPVQLNANINPQGSSTIFYVTVQYNTNLGSPNPLVDLTDEVVEIVPFSTSGWFATRGPGGIASNIETWSLVDSVPLNDALNRASNGDSIEQVSSIFGGTVVTQTDNTKQPIFTANAFNFNPALTFDGVDDFMYSPNGWTGEAYYLAIKTETPVTTFLNTTPPFYAPVSWLSQELCHPGGGFALGGPFTGTLSGEVMTHAVGGGGGNGGIYRTAESHVGASGVVFYQDTPNVFAAIENDAGDYQDLFANGKSVANAIHRIHINFADDEFFLGSFLAPVLPEGVTQDSCSVVLEYQPDGFFNGQIGEILSFNQKHGDEIREKITSYLALKYGVTLDQSVSGGQDYVAHDGETLMWDASILDADTYNNDIAGIGQDNHSALYQPKSRSVNKDSIITIGDPTDLENLEFLTWGNDDGDVLTWTSNPSLVPRGYARIARVWQVQETGEVGDLNVFIHPDDIPSTAANVYILTDDDGDFSNATPHRMIMVGGEWQLEDTYNFSSGEYFSVAYQQIKVEFQNKIVSGPENNPAVMTNILVQGELTESVSLNVSDKTFNYTAGPQANPLNDYEFIDPQVIIVPPGDYRTNILSIPLLLSIVPDTNIELDEYTLFEITGLRAEIVGGDITGDNVAQLTHTYIILNDDSASIIVDPISIQMAEGESAPYTIVLSHQPKVGTQVVVDIFFGEQLEDASGSGVVVGQVIFTSDNWNIPQEVLVWAVEDQVVEGVHFDTVTHAVNAATNDPNYLAIQNVQTVDVQIDDNDILPEEDNDGDDGPTGSGCDNPNGCYDQGDNDGDDVEIPGCTDPDALNTNYAATIDDGSCLHPVVLGESDPPSGGGGNTEDYLEDALAGIGECPYFSGFYKLGDEGPMVARWQAFLNVLLGTDLTIDGRFGPSTDAAVKQYHEQWADIILVPWGHRNPTGYIYKTTNATGNSMIGCPLGTLFISETGEYFNADTYNSSYNLQALTNELRSALNIDLAQLLDGYNDPTLDYTQ